MAHVAKSYGAVPAQRRGGRPHARTNLGGVLSALAEAVVAGGLIGLAVYEGVRLLLDLVY